MNSRSALNWQRVGELFDRAATMTASRRADFLASLAGDDVALRDELEKLLAANAAPGLLDRDVRDLATRIPVADEETLIGKTVGHWRIVDILGHGGMGAVYRAERADGAYTQAAALKLIRLGVDSPEARARFLRERQFLASLQHPNIATLLDGGVTSDGTPYLAMELVDGERIDAYCDARRLTLAQRLRLILQVFAAVQHAHQRLIVHRDLKPSNILVTADGAAKLLDFGIATVVGASSAATATREHPLTPDYAAPEQLAGKPVTTATDVYALGVILTQLLGGVAPQPDRAKTETPALFSATQGENADEIAAARGTSVRQLARTLHGDLNTIVQRARASEPARRYSNAQALATDIEQWLAGRPILARPDSLLYRTGMFVRRNRVAVALSAVAMFALLAATAAVYYAAMHERSQTPSSAAARQDQGVKSIAVLPLTNESGDAKDEYFSDGLSEDLINSLAQIKGLRVISRSSSFQFKGKAQLDVQSIGAKLGAAALLEGTVRKLGDRLRISTELVNAADGTSLWSQHYDRDYKDLFAVQSEIANAVAQELQPQLSARLPAPRTTNPRAHDLYLQGMFFGNKSTEEGLHHALKLFDQSLREDPNNADAWAGIAKVWNWLSDAHVRPLEGYPKSKEAALKALALDPDNAIAHAYLGDAMRVLDRDMPGADREYRHALQLDSNSSDALTFLALNRNTQGDFDESIRLIQQALKVDPLSPIVNDMAALIYTCAGRYDDAIAAAEQTRRIDDSFYDVGPMLAEVYLQQGRYPEAIAAYRKAEQVTGKPQAGLAIAYVRMGQPAEARRILAELEDRAAKEYVSGDNIAAIYVALGDNDNAFRWLQRAFDERAGELEGLGVERRLYPLHKDPRFAELLTKLGLDAQHVLAAVAALPSVPTDTAGDGALAGKSQ